MYSVLGHERSACIERFGALHNGLLNMTYLALRFSRYVNGVAMQHGKVSQGMFPEYRVHSITNGVHAATWLSEPFHKLFDKEIPEWRHDNQYFRSVYGIEPARDRGYPRARQAAALCECEGSARALTTTRTSSPWASLAALPRTSALRCSSATDKRLHDLAERIGGLQILFAGKAHPADNAGKALIREVFADAAKFQSSKLRILYLENYDWDLGQQLTNGVDVWLNTPRRPYEASGTSGMKAALNGVPSLSVLDGWWIEGCAENVTGWSIDDFDDEAQEAEQLYTKLETVIAPLYADKEAFARIRQHCIAMNGTFFNTHRMLGQYVSNAYFPQSSSIASTDQEITDDLREPVLI